MNRATTTQTLGKYRLIERLGQGGMAQVYRAQQPTIERTVAIKVLHAHLAARDDFVERFKREARGLGQLRHPHIVNVIDFDVVVNQDASADYFMVMDFIAGPTLRQVLDQRGALSVDAALIIAEQMADALAYAHKQGVLHRDVKPGNIMFLDAPDFHVQSASDHPSDQPSDQHCVLTDFGIARLLDDAALTMTGAVAGTPTYMSPEAAHGSPIDQRTDLYSLGVVLYEMVSGETPYKGDTAVRVMMQHLHDPLPSLRDKRPDLPEMVVQIIERALAKQPEDRFQSADALRQALLQTRLTLTAGHIADTRMIAAPTVAIQQLATRAASNQPPVKPVLPIPSPGPAQPTRRLRRLVWLPGVIIALLIGLSGAWLLYGQENEQTGGDEFGWVKIIPQSDGQEIVITIDPSADLPALADDQHYHVWLTARNGVLFDLGALPVLRDGKSRVDVQQVASTPYDVLSTIDGALITHEEIVTPTAPSDRVVLRGDAGLERTDALRDLLLVSDLRLNKPLLPAAHEQFAIAQQHAGFLRDALAVGDLPAAQKHGEHLVNIVDGEAGANFGDLNGDGQAQNPGDGVGLRPYLVAIATAINTLAFVPEPVGRAQTASEMVIAAARQVTAADTITEATGAADTIAAQLDEIFDSANQSGALYEASVLVADQPVVSLVKP